MVVVMVEASKPSYTDRKISHSDYLSFTHTFILKVWNVFSGNEATAM